VTAVRAQTRSEIRALLERHGLRARKHLGQHFLADPNIVERIVRAAGVGPSDSVVEIGVGTGTLTRGLAATGARVLGFEIDTRLEPVVAEALAHVPGVDVRFEDAMAADLGSVLEGPGWVMVANLPYNVGTPLVVEVLRNVPAVTRMVVMVQREVADRLVAGPYSPAYGLPSVAVALRATAHREFKVPPQVFLPAPDVESAVVRIERVAPRPLADRAEALASAAFNQRRKMLRRSLTAVLTEPATVIEAAGLDPSLRAEELSAEDYLRLAGAVP
jgi:16S rRNA (adenine1518-N6/adenine1519-N6)-dimethyltransferase